MVTVYSPLRSVLHMNSKDLSIWILPSFFVNVASITYQNGKSALVGGGTHSPHFESDYWCVPEEVAVVALVEA